MKQNPLATLLASLVLLGALAIAGLSYAYIRNARELRSLQFQASRINRDRAMFRELAMETVAYSNANRNPALDKILAEVGIVKTKSPSPQQFPSSATK
jgi:hypothetical protein